MRSTRAVLWVTRMNAGANPGNALREFLRYLHYRDHIQRGDEGRGLDGLVRYVTHRDRAAPQGRLFTRDRNVGDWERHALVAFVKRSLVTAPADQLKQKQIPAAFRFVLSPEDARGLDLRQLTNEIMRQLEQDVGELPPWIAAEHRNTAHPHVHIVMAARRETAPGRFRNLVITRQRLIRMKAAMTRALERQRLDRQRGVRLDPVMPERIPERARSGERSWHRQPTRLKNRWAGRDPLRWRSPRARSRRARDLSWYPMQRAFARLAAYYRREMEREEREAMRQWRLSDRNRYRENEWEVYE